LLVPQKNDTDETKTVLTLSGQFTAGSANTGEYPAAPDRLSKSSNTFCLIDKYHRKNRAKYHFELKVSIIAPKSFH